jgi:hypothetical protein
LAAAQPDAPGHFTIIADPETIGRADADRFARGLEKYTQEFAARLAYENELGDLSAQDEAALYSNPTLVPEPLKENIRSLIWLAQKDDESIQKTLAKFDARSLAAAWIGPEEVLRKLQNNLPEKKLKMLQTYLEKSAPDRNSPAYQSLVDEGLKHEAA